MTSPIFIVGMPRSGTTLLATMLNSHPEVAILPETHLLAKYASLPVRLMSTSVGLSHKGYERFLQSAEWHNADDQDSSSLKEALTDAVARAQTDTDRLRVALSCMGTHVAERQSKRRWGEKTPAHCESVAALLGLFPDAHVVYIYRDPRDVVASLDKVPWAQRGVVRQAARWSYYQRLSYHFERLWPTQFHRVSYEALTNEPEVQLRQLCTRIELNYDPHLIDGRSSARELFSVAREPWKQGTLQPLTSEHVGKWQRSLSKPQRIKVEVLSTPWRYSSEWLPSHPVSGAFGWVCGRWFTGVYGLFRRVNRARPPVVRRIYSRA